MPLCILALGVGALAVALVLSRSRSAAPPAGDVLGGPQLASTALPAIPGTAPEAAAPAVTTLPVGPAVSPSPLVSKTPTALPATPSPVPGELAVPFVPTATPTPWPPTPTPTPPIVAVFRAREKVKFNVSPEDAHVIINGHDIGKADDWDDMGGGESWRFPGVPGVYWVRFELEGYRTTWIKLIADPDAKDKTADVDTELKKAKDHDKKKDEDAKDDE